MTLSPIGASVATSALLTPTPTPGQASDFNQQPKSTNRESVMNLNDLNNNQNQVVNFVSIVVPRRHEPVSIDAILQEVAKQFKGEPCKIWLSGYSGNDAQKAADSLRSDKGNQNWCFSVKAHGASGSFLVIEHSRLAQSGDYGDE